MTIGITFFFIRDRHNATKKKSNLSKNTSAVFSDTHDQCTKKTFLTLLTNIKAKSGNGAWCVAISVPTPRLMVTRRDPANARASHSGAPGRSERHSTIDSTKVITDSIDIAFV